MIKFCRREFTPPDFDPPVLFRYFEKEDHARALCLGYVWISTLEACRRQEGAARDDPAEATRNDFSGYAKGASGDPGFEETAGQSGRADKLGITNTIVHEGMSHDRLYDAWLLCFTESRRPHRTQGIGRFGVRISLPRLFFRHVTNALRLDQDITSATFGRVRYVGRDDRELEASLGPMALVKPPDDYSSQREARMIWRHRRFKHPLQPGIVRCAAVAQLCSRV